MPMLMIKYGGTVNEARIRQLGESIMDLQQNFDTPPKSEFLKKKASLWRSAAYSGW